MNTLCTLKKPSGKKIMSIILGGVWIIYGVNTLLLGFLPGIYGYEYEKYTGFPYLIAFVWFLAYSIIAFMYLRQADKHLKDNTLSLSLVRRTIDLIEIIEQKSSLQKKTATPCKSAKKKKISK